MTTTCIRCGTPYQLAEIKPSPLPFAWRYCDRCREIREQQYKDVQPIMEKKQ